MEHQRFEDLTRGLATARSRRDVVKALFGTLLAGGAIAGQRGGAFAQDPCTTDADCAAGMTCVEGVCTPDGPPPCETDDDCTGEGEICCAGGCLAIECCIDDADPNARCPAGTACFEGQCDPVDEPVACESDDDCETGICCAGFCRDIECCIDEEDPNARCPEGTSCFEGVCDPITEPGACASDTECGDDEICCAGFCRAIECCIDEADPNARCPEGTSCFEGVCDPITDGGKKDDGTGGKKPVVQLPSTGSGTASGGSSRILGAILAGGAAAAAGLGLKMRRAQPTESPAEDR